MGHQNAALLSKLACLSAERRRDVLIFIFFLSSILLSLSPPSPTRESTKENRDGVKPELAGIPIRQKTSWDPAKMGDFLKGVLKIKNHLRVEAHGEGMNWHQKAESLSENSVPIESSETVGCGFRERRDVDRS